MRDGVWDPRVPVEASAYAWRERPVLKPSARAQANAGPGIVDLFCGGGGFSMGFAHAGFCPVLGVDHHMPSTETYSRNHPTAATILGDIRSIADELIVEALGAGDVAVVTAGVPCQGFSRSNRKRYDEDPRNYLFWEFIRVIGFLQPSYVVLENVSGMRTTKGGAFVSEIRHAIAEVGYRTDVRVLNAADYGVPQIRNRIFFLGARPAYPIRWPLPTHGPVVGTRYLTVADAIGDLPPLESGEAKASYESPPRTPYQVQMRGSNKVLHNHEAPKHHKSTVMRIASTEPGQPMYPRFSQRIRLSLEQPSPTIVAGGIRPQFFFGHPTQPRGLTVRERCRIQSIPDSCVIAGGIVQGRVQTGNAVPPLLARAIAGQILSGLNGEGDNGTYYEPSREDIQTRASQMGPWQ